MNMESAGIMPQQVEEFSSDVPFENPLAGIVIPLDGVKFPCKGRLSVLQMSKLASQAITPGLAEAAEAASIYQTLALAFGTEYDRFEAHVELRNTPDETILRILQYINTAVQENIERITARPTQPSSSSPAGPKDKGELPARTVSLSKQTITTGAPETKPAKTRTPRKTPSGAGRRTG
jgi:hypothetical protein